jgi:hypothetical protein
MFLLHAKKIEIKTFKNFRIDLGLCREGHKMKRRPRILLKGIVSREFGTLFLFHWIDFKVVIGPDQVYFSF